MNNHVITWNPVDRSSDAILVTSLKGVDNSENFGGVTTSGSRVRENETDSLLWVDDEDRSDGECNALGVDVCDILVVKPSSLISMRSRDNAIQVYGGSCLHVICIGNLSILVTNDWEGKLASGDLINILDPSTV